MNEKLSGYEDSKELLDFVVEEDMVVVNRTSYQSTSSINGVVRKGGAVRAWDAVQLICSLLYDNEKKNSGLTSKH